MPSGNGNDGYSIFEVIPYEKVDFTQYRDHSIIYDSGLEVRYMIIHQAKLIVINPKKGEGSSIGISLEEETTVGA